MNRRFLRTAALALAFFATTQSALAQDDLLDLPQDRPRIATFDADDYGFGSDDWDPGRSDSAAPLGIPLVRIPRPGTWLFSYRYSRTSFDGLRDGRSNLSSADAFALGFDTVPFEMTDESHTIEGVYGLDGNWSLYARVPYIRKESKNVTVSSASFTTESDGVGDIVVGGIYDWDREGSLITRFHLGLSLPTGSADEQDRDETGTNVTLPYPMQIGTGSFGVEPGFTVMQQRDDFTWGLFGKGHVPLEVNDEGWSVPGTLDLSAFAAYPFNESFSGSLRLQGSFFGDYHEQAADLDPTSNPTEDPHHQGGNRFDIHGGLNYEIGDGYAQDNRIGIEIGVPVDEWLDGPALSREWMVTFGWQLSY